MFRNHTSEPRLFFMHILFHLWDAASNTKNFLELERNYFATFLLTSGPSFLLFFFLVKPKRSEKQFPHIQVSRIRWMTQKNIPQSLGGVEPGWLNALSAFWCDREDSPLIPSLTLTNAGIVRAKKMWTKTQCKIRTVKKGKILNMLWWLYRECRIFFAEAKELAAEEKKERQCPFLLFFRVGWKIFPVVSFLWHLERRKIYEALRKILLLCEIPIFLFLLCPNSPFGWCSVSKRRGTLEKFNI